MSKALSVFVIMGLLMIVGYQLSKQNKEAQVSIEQEGPKEVPVPLESRETSLSEEISPNESTPTQKQQVPVADSFADAREQLEGLGGVEELNNLDSDVDRKKIGDLVNFMNEAQTEDIRERLAELTKSLEEYKKNHRHQVEDLKLKFQESLQEHSDET